MKRLAPGPLNSILARVLLLTVGLMLLSIAALVAILQTPISERVLDQAVAESSRSIAELVWLLETSPAEAQSAVLSIYASRSRVARIRSGFAEGMRPYAARQGLLVRDDTAITERLRHRDIRFRTLGLLELLLFVRDEPLRTYYAASVVHMAIELEDKRVLNVWIAPSILYTDSPYSLLVLLGLIGVVTLVLGLAIYWVIMRPIQLLERDAEIVGLAETAIPISENGPRELRRLSRALNHMRSRLAGLVREREQIMVAIAHDIRSGLTKVRLRMEASETLSPQVIEPDIAQMEHLLADMMAYVRAEHPVTGHELVELCGLVTALAKAAPYGVVVERDTDTEFVVAGNKVALTRLFENLLENARRYGAGLVLLHVEKVDEGLIVDVIDDGPGIPSEELGQIFEPFVRGEGSRNTATGGTGLGLSIARAIAHTHGAEITLSNRPERGLRARTFFPRELAT